MIIMIYTIIIFLIILGLAFFYCKKIIPNKKKSKFTTILHLGDTYINGQTDIQKVFHSNVLFIESKYNSDIVFLGYIINNWEKMPNLLIFLRNLNWLEKKSIISFINKLDLIWGNMTYINLENYIQYVLTINNNEILNEDKNMMATVKKQIVSQSNDIYVNFDFKLLLDNQFKIFWDIYMLPYFGEIQSNIHKIMNINKQKTTGQFIVHYKQFYYRPKDFYIHLLKYLKDGGINYMPILWDIILS